MLSRIRLTGLLSFFIVYGCVQSQFGRQSQQPAQAGPPESAPGAPIDQQEDGAKPISHSEKQREEQPERTLSSKQIADWVRDAYASRQILAYDFTVSQVQRNDKTWTYKGSALYSGRRSLVTMTETEGTRVGRQLRYACDIDGDRAILTEQDRDDCISYSVPADVMMVPTHWDRRLDVNTKCIFGNLLKSWLGSDPIPYRVKFFHEDISIGTTVTEEDVTDADGKTHACYAVMNGVEGSYEIYFVDKVSHLVRRWYVDRTSISRDSVYTYRTPDPLAPDTFRIPCSNTEDEAPGAASEE